MILRLDNCVIVNRQCMYSANVVAILLLLCDLKVSDGRGRRLYRHHHHHEDKDDDDDSEAVAVVVTILLISVCLAISVSQAACLCYSVSRWVSLGMLSKEKFRFHPGTFIYTYYGKQCYIYA